MRKNLQCNVTSSCSSVFGNNSENACIFQQLLRQFSSDSFTIITQPLGVCWSVIYTPTMMVHPPPTGV